MNYIIGVDLDNTIVSYDSLIHRVALGCGFINENAKKSKKYISGLIRQLPDGEKKWQELQAIVYGQRIKEAQLIRGVEQFFKLCQKNRVKVYIISHKTEFVNYCGARINLRASALDWMESKKFFKDEGLSLSRNNIYFGATRKWKIRFIKKLRCTHFIDDLEETFIEDSFPQGVEKILYDPHGEGLHLQGVKIFNKWEDINGYFFKSRK